MKIETPMRSTSGAPNASAQPCSVAYFCATWTASTASQRQRARRLSDAVTCWLPAVAGLGARLEPVPDHLPRSALAPVHQPRETLARAVLSTRSLELAGACAGHVGNRTPRRRAHPFGELPKWRCGLWSFCGWLRAR